MQTGRTYWTGRLVIENTGVTMPVSLQTIMDKTSTGLAKRSLCCSSHVEYKQVCGKCKKELKKEEIGRGYALGNELMPVEESMLEAIKPKGDDTIRVTGVLESFPLVMDTDKKYWLNVHEDRNKRTKETITDLKGRDAWMLLNAGLQATGKTLVGSCVMRGNEYIVAVSSVEGRLMLSCLYYATDRKEVLAVDYGSTPDTAKVKQITSFLGKLPNADLSAFKDTYSENLKHLLMKEPLVTVQEPVIKQSADALSMFA